MNRRVAVFREDFLPPSETFVRDHLLGLRRFEPVAVTRAVRPNPLLVPGIAIESATATNPAVRRAAGARRRLFRRDIEQDLARSYQRILRRAGPDLVHAHFGTDGAVILPVTRALRIPLIVTFHGYDATVDLEVLRTWEGSAATLARSIPQMWGQVAAVVAVSRHIADRIVARGADRQRIEIISCGVDTRVFSEIAPPNADSARLLFVGRLVEKKGCIDLLQALSGMTLPPELTIVGDGPLRPELEHFARDHRLRVTFVGTADSAQVRSHLADADVVVMPSKQARNGDSEGLPLVALEAGASARPIVGYAHSGLVDAVNNGSTGLLADEGDIAGLRHHLETITSDRDLRQRMGSEARQHVQCNFEHSRQLQRLEDLYERVASAAPRPEE